MMPSESTDGERDDRSALLRDGDHIASPSYGTTHAAESTENGKPPPESSGGRSPRTENVVLLLGSFLVNADSAMTYSIFRKIGSEFNQLSSASWIVTGWITGTIVSQPLFGKLSDIYGRKAMLISICASACVGQIIAGIGFSFWGVILGRFITGISNAGMSVLVSTVIVDMVPFQHIAFWRSVIYASNQVGRSSGLPLGGIITDATNWRWALLFQVPLYLFIGIFIWRKMEFPLPQTDDDTQDMDENSRKAKFKRIDFSGAISLGLSNVSLLLCLDQAPRQVNMAKNLLAVIPFGTWIAFLVIFVCIEAYRAPEPILPMRLLANRNVSSAYAIQFFTGAVQVGLYSSIPLYFQVTQGASTFQVSMHLLFLAVGAITGTLFSGAFITKTGRYRRLIQVVMLIYIGICVTVFLRWRGDTSWIESAYGAVAGLCFSIPLSATFIALTDGLPHSQTAVATSGFYLCLNLGSNVGVGVSNLIVHAVVQQELTKKLAGVPGKSNIIRDITSNIDNLKRLSSRIRRIAVDAYTASLVDVWLFFVVTACLSFAASLLLKREQLYDPKGKKPVISESPEEDWSNAS